jgi:methyl-accepting chemotaxis protein
MQWPALTVDALDSIRDSLEKLNHRLGTDSEAREALQNIGDEVNGLARVIDEILDVTSARRESAG